MPVILSGSTRLLMAGLLSLALLFQIAFSSTRLVGYSYAHNGRFAMAEENWKDSAWFFRHASDWFPFDQHWYYHLAVSEHNRGNRQSAVVALEQSLKYAPTYIYSLNRATGIMIETGNLEAASRLINRSVLLVPNAWEPTYLAGLATLSSGDLLAAQNILRTADHQSLTPSPLLLGFLAQAANELGNSEIALDSIDRAIDTDNTNARHWMVSGHIRFERGELDESQQAYEQAALLYETGALKASNLPVELAIIHARLGHIRAKTGGIDQSVQHFYHAVGNYADLETYATLLGWLHEQQAALLPAQPTEEQLKWACVLAAGKLWEPADEIFCRVDEAVQVWPVLARYSYAMTLRNTGKFEEAIRVFRTISSHDYISATAYAETLFEAGRPAAARFEYVKISTTLPLSDAQHDVIQKRIGELTTAQ